MISAAYGQDLVRLPLAIRHSRRAGNLLLPAYAFQVIRARPCTGTSYPPPHERNGNPTSRTYAFQPIRQTPVRAPDHSAAQGALCFATHMRCCANM